MSMLIVKMLKKDILKKNLKMALLHTLSIHPTHVYVNPATSMQCHKPSNHCNDQSKNGSGNNNNIDRCRYSMFYAQSTATDHS